MKKFFAIFFLILFSCCLQAQTSQIKVGTTGIMEIFADSKYNPTDGSSIHVGVIGSTGVGNGKDCYIIKLDASKQIIWQKTISNLGDDFFSRVIRCANGDFVAVGAIEKNGKQRGFIARISSTGVLLWNLSSQNTGSANGDIFADVCELSNGNLAIVGTTNNGGGTANGIVVMLNNSGTQLWGRIVNYSSSDELFTVAQLPSGNLIIAGTLYISYRYKALIVEMNPSTAAILSQNEYHIATSVSGINTNINTIWPVNSSIVSGNFCFSAVNCSGFTSNVDNPISINTYNPSTKSVTCQLYYHSGFSTASGLYVSVNSANDNIVSFSYGVNQSYISRVISGVVSYSRKLDNTEVGIVYKTSINGTTLLISGQSQSGDAYIGMSTTSFPLSATPCNITTVNNLQVTSPSITRSTNSTSFLNANAVMLGAGAVLINTTSIVSNICGVIPCIQKVLLQPY